MSNALTAFPPATVLFDLDGTVWDSEPGILDALRHTLAALGIAVPDDAALASNLGPPLQVMLAELGVPAERVDEGRDVYRARYLTHGEHMFTVFDGIAELLDDLRAAGRRLATATSKGIEPTRRMLDSAGLSERFDVIAGASMDASAASKEAVIASALDLLGGPDPASTVIVGDRHYDVAGGRRFGLVTVAVRWGYAPDGELDSVGADAVVDDVAGLRAVLLGTGGHTGEGTRPGR